jgi:hypothetical protein
MNGVSFLAARGRKERREHVQEANAMTVDYTRRNLLRTAVMVAQTIWPARSAIDLTFLVIGFA